MEFPDLGSHCSKQDCRQLDFLPIRCQSCQKMYCKDHYIYDQHGCSNPLDVQVPVCPLCEAPIPISNRDVPPDVYVEQHILTNCKSQPAKAYKGKIFTNKCSYPKCQTKETVKINCGTCKKTFCLRHRLEADHNCGKQTNSLNKKIARSSQNDKEKAKKLQEQEDYQMALALQQSLNTQAPSASTSQRSRNPPNNKESQCNQM